MAAMREKILHGLTNEKCHKCYENFKSDNKKPDCITKDRCIYTGDKRVNLTYEEKRLLDELYDFLSTNEIVSKSFDRRQQILNLAGYYMKLRSLKDGKN